MVVSTGIKRLPPAPVGGREFAARPQPNPTNYANGGGNVNVVYGGGELVHYPATPKQGELPLPLPPVQAPNPYPWPQ